MNALSASSASDLLMFAELAIVLFARGIFRFVAMVEHDGFDSCFLRAVEARRIRYVRNDDADLRIQLFPRDGVDDRLEIAATP